MNKLLQHLESACAQLCKPSVHVVQLLSRSSVPHAAVNIVQKDGTLSNVALSLASAPSRSMMG